MEIIKETIEKEYNDWNYDRHRVIDTTPTEEDFMITVHDFLEFERKLAMVENCRKAGYSDKLISHIWNN